METPKEIGQKLAQIQSTAALLRTIKNSESELFNQLYRVERSKLKEVQSRFANESGPVNQLRLYVANALLSKVRVDRNSIEEKKIEIQNQSGRDVFRVYKNPFTIFFPFFINLTQSEENDVLDWFSRSIVVGLNFLDDQFKIKKVTFEGARNLGEDRLWLAIFNSKHEKQQTAQQFFLEINFAGINISFYDRPNETHIESRFFLIEEFNIAAIIDFFEKHKEAFYLDGVEVGFEETLAEFDFFPADGSIYKLSHGTGVITDESYYDMIAKNVVVVHEDTASMGKLTNTQFEDFENASIGELFYLCRSNQRVDFVGQFIGPLEENNVVGLNKSWKQRKYRVLKVANTNNGYAGSETRWWLPSFNSTFVRIPKSEYAQADREIFAPFFDTSINAILLRLTTRGLRGGPFSILDNDVEPILDARIIAERFADLIVTLKDNTGQMLGVFGSWGRGKTYFVNQLCKNLLIDFKTQREEPAAPFYFLKFHAWKYQDTEGVWAYLYEQIAQKYYTHKDEEHWKYPLSSGWRQWWSQNVRYPIKRTINEWSLLFRLNILRKGKKELIAFGFSILLALAYFVVKLIWPCFIEYISHPLKWVVFPMFAGVNFLLLVRFIQHLRKIGNKGKRIVKEYTHRPTFNRLLGVQAEIQQELIFLLKAWIRTEFIKEQNEDGGATHWKERLIPNEKRLLIFIDDIDRCSEERLIQVIDALRVMLEDEEIAKRVIVIAAVDENILERAIALKYKDIQVLSCHDCEEVKIKGRPMKDLVREYMDKLFIGGLKLAPLKSTERAEIIENYADQAGVLEKEGRLNQIISEANNLNHQDEIATHEVAPISDEIVIGKPDDDEPSGGDKEGYYLISSQEMNWLKDQAMSNENCTPRQLRIYLFRYLFAKSLAMSYADLEELDEQWCRFIIQEIDELSKDQYHPFNKLGLENLPSTSQKLKEFTPKLLQMVVPY